MANEIQQIILLSCDNGDFHFPQVGRPNSIDQAVASGGYPGHITVSLKQVNVDLSKFIKPGILYMRNMGEYGTGTGSPTVTFGPTSGGVLIPLSDMKEGEEASFRLTGLYTPTLAFKSTELDTGVQLYILED